MVMQCNNISYKLKQYRTASGLCRKEVARALQLKDSSSLSRWESGLSIPKFTIVIKLAIIYGTLPHLLYEDLWQETKDELYKHAKPLLSRAVSTRKRFNRASFY